jgi:hypothetical protein
VSLDTTEGKIKAEEKDLSEWKEFLIATNQDIMLIYYGNNFFHWCESLALRMFNYLEEVVF